MFHPEELLNKVYIRKVWQAANELPTGTVEEHDLPEICRNMDTLISSESHDVRDKLSLRTSAILINGAAKLYRTASDNILDDVISLHMNITQRKRNLSIDYSLDSSVQSSVAVQNCETSYPPSKRNKTRHTTAFHQETSSSDRRSITTRNPSEDTRSDECLTGIVDSDAIQNTEDLGLTFTTPPIENGMGRHSDYLAEPDVDKNLPYGCLMIYKDYNCRIPNCFVFSSLKNDLKQILKEHKML